MTLLELLIALAILGIILSSIMGAASGIQDAFVENQIVSHLTLRSQMAMDRIIRLAGQALTVDPQFALLLPASGSGWHCLRFRTIQLIDAATGEPVYDDSARVYILGPDPGPHPCAGLIVGRGPDLNGIYAVGKGPNNVLGTIDDNINTSIAGFVPAVELLVPDTFTPQNGEMFQVNVTPSPVGRLLTFTLRLNARDKNGNFLMPNDLVLSERIALRQ